MYEPDRLRADVLQETSCRSFKFKVFRPDSLSSENTERCRTEDHWISFNLSVS